MKRLWLTFAAGGMAGLMLAVCMGIHTGRPGTVGGEALIIPLMVLLIYVGWQAGQLEAAAGRGKDGGTMKKRVIDACAQVLTALMVAAVLVVLACVAGLLVLGWHTLMSVLHLPTSAALIIIGAVSAALTAAALSNK